MNKKKRKDMDPDKFQADRLLSYFKKEWIILLFITVSGLIYNIGLIVGPWFEGKMTNCLVDILNGQAYIETMLVLVVGYVVSIVVVQVSRYIKRFYVRRFGNNVNRRMKEILYESLVQKSRASLREEGEGSIMTKAILDVDDCAEGMRKFTTEVFDTGVALAAYAGMLLWYDWKLALLCMLFPPISYLIAEKMKKIVQKAGAAYKKQSEILSTATLDRAQNAITYRVFGCERKRKQAYEKHLMDYEKSAVKANIWGGVMPPVYRVISMAGVLFILYFGQKNVLGTGFSTWTIASFTTFLSCFVKLSVKSSSAAKLFNSVHKAQVSWKRIKPFLIERERMKKEKKLSQEENKAEKEKLPMHGGRFGNEKKNFTKITDESIKKSELQQESASALKVQNLKVEHLSFAYPDGKKILNDISFSVQKGQMIGITGPVACGKSTLGKVFLMEYPYEGKITLDGVELSKLDSKVLTQKIGYLGHDPELFQDSVKNNILLGSNGDAQALLKLVSMEEEVDKMDNGIETLIGSGGVRLSGGQAKRLALARTFCFKKPVMILDDPFSALDKQTEREIFVKIREQVQEDIVLLISHRLYLFPQMDQVIWMEKGKNVIGTHEEILAKVPEYRKLFEEEGDGMHEAAKE